MEATKIINYLRSGFSLFWIKTFEPNRVREVVYDMIKTYQRKDGGKYKVKEWKLTDEPNPVPTMEGLQTEPEFTVLFAYNFHWAVDKPQVIQTIQDHMPSWQAQGKALVVVSPNDNIPLELSKSFVLMDFSLPNEDEIVSSIHHVMPDDFTLPEKEVGSIVNACKGLTRNEMESSLSLSFVEGEGKTFKVETINDYKAASIRKTGFLDVLESSLTFSDIIGYNNIKQFILETIRNLKAKGIITIGPPGCGKTTLMKAIVGELGMFGLSVNMGKLFSKFQGETGQNVRMVIDIITAIGPCLVLIDEFEKQFAGAASDGTTDGGTTRRATGEWLDFLQNRPQGVYIVATCNSFIGIPPEYLRPGRWDSSPFFIDLPTFSVKKNILEHYLGLAGMKVPKKIPNMDNYSGAEVEALVHIADMRGISLMDAEKCIIATATTNEKQITDLRNWAKDRTIPAESIPGVKVINGGKRSLDV